MATSKSRATPLLVFETAQRETVKELRGAITDILKIPHIDNETKQRALEVLSKGLQNGPVSINNTTFNG